MTIQGFRIPRAVFVAALAAGLAGCPGPAVQSGPQKPVGEGQGKIVLLHFFAEGDAGARADLLEVREFARKWTPRGVPTLGLMRPAAGAEAIFPPGTVIAEAAESLIGKLNKRLGEAAE